MTFYPTEIAILLWKVGRGRWVGRGGSLGAGRRGTRQIGACKVGRPWPACGERRGSVLGSKCLDPASV
eukprot:4823954-Prorocentrum_lima.AAC.1